VPPGDKRCPGEDGGTKRRTKQKRRDCKKERESLNDETGRIQWMENGEGKWSLRGDNFVIEEEGKKLLAGCR